MSSSHRYHSASGPKVSPKCIQIHNNARRIVFQCFDHRSHICCPVASPLRLSMDRCCWRCSLWPMGYKVCSRLLVLFSYSVEVLGGLCLFVYFDYSARILSHDSFTKRVLSRQFFYWVFSTDWKMSVLCRLSAAGGSPRALRRQISWIVGLSALWVPLEIVQGHSSGNKALKSLHPTQSRFVYFELN